MIASRISCATTNCGSLQVLVPKVTVTKVCPSTPVAPGGLLSFSGIVSNAGAVTPPTRADVRLFRPSHSVDHLRKLLATRLEQVKFAAPVGGICLRAPVVELMAGRQAELFDESPREEELATARSVKRIAAAPHTAQR